MKRLPDWKSGELPNSSSPKLENVMPNEIRPWPTIRSTPKRALISPPPYHAEIAARIAARREAVTRALRALESAGLVERRRGALVLTDLPALVALFRDPRGRTA